MNEAIGDSLDPDTSDDEGGIRAMFDMAEEHGCVEEQVEHESPLDPGDGEARSTPTWRREAGTVRQQAGEGGTSCGLHFRIKRMSNCDTSTS